MAFILHFLKPHWRLVAWLLACVLAGSTAESLQPYIIKLLVDTLGAAPDIHAPDILKRTLIIGAGFAFLRIVIVGGWWGFNSIFRQIIPSAESNIRQNLLKAVLQHSYIWFLNGFSGRSGQRIDTAVRAFREIFLLITDSMLHILIRATTLLGLLMFANWRLGVGMVVWICIVVPVQLKLTQSIQGKTFDWIASCGDFIESAVDVFSNMFSVRSNGGAMAMEIANGKKRADEAQSKHREMIRTWRRNSATRTNMNTLLYATLFILGFWNWQNGKISIGDFAMTLTAGIGMVDVLDGSLQKLQNFAQEFGSLHEALKGLLADLPPPLKAAALFTPQKGAIGFTDVSFAYRPNMPVLQNFSLKIEAGEKVALVGPSGAGKSTLISLLLGLWETQQGCIQIDGQDITAVDRESLLQHVAVIPQDTSLFHRTLFENIAYGSSSATTASVEAAARAAHIHDFIIAQPQGYETMVGERGLKLSGGQRQRIAVSRAIHKNAPILLLDEATSALDSESEQAIQDALHRLIPNKTVLAIAHRLSTIAHVDRIIVMEGGQILEQGSHAELLATNGRYARLWSMQSGGYLPEPKAEEWDATATATLL